MPESDRDKPEFLARGGSRQLVVLLHAVGQAPPRLFPLREAVAEALPDADIWLPALPITRNLTRARGAAITQDLVRRIDALVAARAVPDGSYAEIILIGHSYGAALARAIWASAMGGQPDGTADLDAALPWGRRISRLVLLAAVARGWDQFAPVKPSLRLRAWGASLIEMMTGPGWGLLDLRRGAPWITTIRLQTLDINHRLDAAALPVTVQLLGAGDDVVAPADNVDLAAGANFFYVEVPATNHDRIVDVDEPGQATRRLLFQRALTEPAETLRALSLSPEAVRDMVDENLNDHDLDWTDPAPGVTALRVRPDVARVVFVIHGIRDYGHWTKRLAVRIKETGRNRKPAPIAVRTVTSSYGFFPMAPFVIRAERRKRAGWLMDQYVTARAVYPNARFSFIGHSNGTYLAATALRDCPAIRFDDVIFAGSVVRQRFDWDSLMQPQPFGARQSQVGRVLNYVATGDDVVALLPGGVEWMGIFDLGAAGHHGFTPETPRIRNIRFVPGDHSAALQDDHWNEIAGFVLGDDFPPKVLERRPPYRHDDWTPRTGAIGRAPWLALAITLIVALGVLVVLPVSVFVWCGTAALIIGLPLLTLLLARVVTRL